jgi:ATP-dependent Zn protease
MSTKIQNILPRMILDSRGFPTIEVEIILDNRVIIDLIVEQLLDVETMDGEQFRELLSTYTILPRKNAPYISKFS